MNSVRTKIAQALDKLCEHRRYVDFQRLALQVARKTWTGLRASELSHDEGVDAIVPFAADGGVRAAFASSVNGDFGKLLKDCERIEETDHELELLVFATTLPIQETEKRKWSGEVKKHYGWTLEVITREHLISVLEHPEMWCFCRDYLDLELSGKEPRSSLASIRTATLQVLQSLKRTWRFDSQLTIQVPVSIRTVAGGVVQPGATKLIRHSEIPELLGIGERCWLEGEPGSGKTWTILDIAERILASDEKRVPVLVSLRGWALAGRSLLEYIAHQAAFQLAEVTPAALAKAADAGLIVFLLNGWNEVGSSDVERVLSEIDSFLDQSPGASALICSRPTAQARPALQAKHLKLEPLGLTEQREAIRRSGLTNPAQAIAMIQANAAVAELSAIPLFLQEIVRGVRLGSAVPIGRRDLLQRMVQASTDEHKPALTKAPLRGFAEAYLRHLAWSMNQVGTTALRRSDARRAALEVGHNLVAMRQLAAAPDPDELLSALAAGHLLLAVEEEAVAFQHQQFQEYFAALELADRIENWASGDSMGPFPEWLGITLNEYSWEETLFLAVEHLLHDNKAVVVAKVVDRFSNIDLEATCRMAGAFPALWSTIGAGLGSIIHSLANHQDQNVRWLATRCAAATGQAAFSDLVWRAVRACQIERDDCLQGVLPAATISALGPGLVELLINEPYKAVRMSVLSLCRQCPGSLVEPILHPFIERESDPDLVRYAAFIRTEVGARHSIRQLLRLLQRQNWPLDGVRYLFRLHGRPSGWLTRLVKRKLKTATEEEGIRLIELWRDSGDPGWIEQAQELYLRIAGNRSPAVAEQRLPQPPMFVFRRRKESQLLSWLRSASPAWAAVENLNDILRHGNWNEHVADHFSALSTDDMTRLVDHALSELDRETGPTGSLPSYDILAECAPQLAGHKTLLKAISAAEHPYDEEKMRLFHTVMGQLPRAAVVRAALKEDFADLQTAEIRTVLRLTLIGSPGAGRVKSSLNVNEADAYHSLLHRWAERLPLMDKGSAYDWALLATLIGELEDPADADFLFSLLQADENRLQREIDTYREAWRLYEQSGRQSPTPGARDWMSYDNWHIAALSRVTGNRAIEVFRGLLTHPRHIGEAAFYLAYASGAEPVDTYGSISSRSRFDEIQIRCSRGIPPLSTTSRSTLRNIQNAIETALERAKDSSEPGIPAAVSAALRAVALLCEPADVEWLLSRYEQDLPRTPLPNCQPLEACEILTLRGIVLDGKRLAPLLSRTWAEMKDSFHHSGHDRACLVTKALFCLFFSSAPEIAMHLLDGELKHFWKSGQSRVLLGFLKWNRDPKVIRWLQTIRVQCMLDDELSYVWLTTLTSHLRDPEAAEFLLSLPALLGTAASSRDTPSNIRRALSAAATESPQFLERALERAASAPVIREAQAWLLVLGEVPDPRVILLGLDYSTRFGPAVGVIESLFPSKQGGGEYQTAGWFTHSCDRLYRFEEVVVALSRIAAGGKTDQGAAARRALAWIERERLLDGPHSAGRRRPHACLGHEVR